MDSYFQINIAISIFGIITFCVLKKAPARLKFYIAIVALTVWLLPWSYIKLPAFPDYIARPSDIVNVVTENVPAIPIRELSFPTAFKFENISPPAQQRAKTDIPPPPSGETLAAVETEQSIWTDFKITPPWLLAFLFFIGGALFARDIVNFFNLQRRWRKRSIKANHLWKLVGTEVPDYEIRSLSGQGPGMATGILRPTIWIDKNNKSEQVIRTILLHELTHIKQRDPAWLWYITFIQRVFWWNPLVWALTKFAREAIELSCDERCKAQMPKDHYHKGLIVAVLNSCDSSSYKTAVGIHLGRRFNLKRIELLKQTFRLNFKHIGVLSCSIIVSAWFSWSLASYSLADDQKLVIEKPTSIDIGHVLWLLDKKKEFSDNNNDVEATKFVNRVSSKYSEASNEEWAKYADTIFEKLKADDEGFRDSKWAIHVEKEIAKGNHYKIPYIYRKYHTNRMKVKSEKIGRDVQNRLIELRQQVNYGNESAVLLELDKLKQNPYVENGLLWPLYSDILIKQKRYKDAITLYSELYAERDHFRETRSARLATGVINFSTDASIAILAKVYNRDKNIQGAIRVLEKYINNNEVSTAKIYATLGSFYFKQKNYSQAIKYTTLAKEFDAIKGKRPKIGWLRTLKASHEALGNKKEHLTFEAQIARKQYEPYRQANTISSLINLEYVTNPTDYTTGFDRSQFDEKQAYLWLIQDRDKKFIDESTKIRKLQEQREYDKAMSMIDSMFTEQGDSIDDHERYVLLERKAEIRAKLKWRESAIPVYHEMLNIESLPTEMRARALYTLASLYKNSGYYDKALEAFTAYMSLMKNPSPMTMVELAVIHSLRNDNNSCLQVLNQAVRQVNLDAKKVPEIIWKTLANVHWKLQNVDAAIDTMERLARDYPSQWNIESLKKAKTHSHLAARLDL